MPKKAKILQKFCNIFTQLYFFLYIANAAIVHPQSLIFSIENNVHPLKNNITFTGLIAEVL